MRATLVMFIISIATTASATTNDYDYHSTVMGPGGVNIWGTGVLKSPTLTSTAPAIFDVSPANSHGSDYLSFNFKASVEYIPDSGLEFNGFMIGVCNDLNDDGFCAFGDDHMGFSYANGPRHEGDIDGCKKDTKDICDGTDAEVILCVERDRDLIVFPDGEWDEIYVFIYAWIKESATGLTGDNRGIVDDGTTIGLFDVYGFVGSVQKYRC